ncbi:heme-binding protein [Halomarina halobia]|uniref:Heme-binding protein n=1 Tax=Halomarina halobia TaxID=3033386 RepID=A0ABD6AER9_9EURY|nr:heme-binding protein [Halomarina sp. PSR21]
MVNLSTATAVVDAAVEEAEEIEVPMCIAVVDEGANLVAFRRMDGALLASVDIARGKAYTAVSLQMPTADLAEVAQPGESLFGIHTTNDGRIVVFGGGVPLRDGGTVVGAIGVSGGSVDEDVTVAEAGVAAFEP